MKNKAIVTATFVLIAVSTSLAGAIENHVLSVAGFGEVRIKTHTSNPNPTSPPFLTFEDKSGKILKRIDFQLEGAGPYPSTAKVKVIPMSKGTNPLIIAVASSPGGSDIHFESTIIGFVNGQIQEVLAKHIESSSQDALCIENMDENQKASLVLFHFLWEEAHYEPHRYEATSFVRDGNVFKQVNVKQTKKKHSDWEGAAAELGYHCNADLISEANQEYK